MKNIRILSIDFMMAGGCLLAGTAHPQSSQKLLLKGDLVYQGAFRVPEAGFDVGGTALVYNHEGKTLYAAARNQQYAEITVPEIVNSTKISSLKTASFVQKFADVTEGKLETINPGDPNGKSIGGGLVFNSQLILSGWAYYDANGSQVKSHFASSMTLATKGDLKGPYQVGTVGAGFVSGYMGLIPTEWQPSFEGPAITGQCCIPIISRPSSGPALSVFNPGDIGKANTVPANPLVYYDLQHETLGKYGASGKNMVFNGASSVNGVVFASGTRTVLFIGSHGIGEWCYGEGATCGDKADGSKGNHAYPYVYQMWAYDALDLIDVKKGVKKPWDIRPYAYWTFNLPFETDDLHAIGGATYDAVNQRIFISQMHQDPGSGGSYLPVMHVFKVNAEGASTGIGGGVKRASGLSLLADKTAGGVKLSFPGAENKAVQAAIYDLSGNLITDLSPNIRHGHVDWNASGNASGLYLIKAKVGENAITRSFSF